MENRKQVLAISTAVIGIIALIILGTSLNQLVLEPGLPFMDLWAFLVKELAGGFVTGGVTEGVDVGIGKTLVEIVRAVYTIALICFPIAIFLMLTSKESRKRLIRTLLLLFLLTIVLSRYVMNSQITEEEILLDAGATMPEPSDLELETSITEEFESNIPRWIVLTISTVLVITVIVIGYVLYRILFPTQQQYAPFSEIAEQAQAALDAVQLGADYRNIIMQCYAEMLRIVREQRGLKRNSAVTASEFIASLVKMGYPEDAVKQLTKLFEDARYGSKQHTPQQEQTAISSLQNIVESFRVTS